MWSALEDSKLFQVPVDQVRQSWAFFWLNFVSEEREREEMINKKHLNLGTYHNQRTYIYNIFVPFAGRENVQTSSSS